MLSNQHVADVFANIADSMELLGEGRFKYESYRRAADTIRHLPRGLHDYLERGILEEIPGVGPAIAGKIAELLQTGRLQFYERLRAEVPDGVLDVLRVPGIGPKTAWRLYTELGVTTLEALEGAARGGQIRTLKGLGRKLESRILAGLEARSSGPERYLLGDGLRMAQELIAVYRATAPQVVDVRFAGSLRRSAPTIGDIDLLALSADATGALDAFASLPHVAAIDHRDGDRIDVRLHNGKPCSLAVAGPEIWGVALVLWTGSAAHHARLQQRAQERGLRLDETGLLRQDMLVPTPDEGSLYRALDLPFIEPELREDWGEIEAAAAGRLPRLVELSEIRGDLHTHTDWSDGGASLAAMADAAQHRGYHYYAITDHSYYMGMVNGLDAARLRAQRVEIDRLNDEYWRRGVDFRLLQGIEVDILPDGTLALADEVLAGLDWVVASLHVNLRQDRETVTARLLKAIRNPHVDCIGHPTGRLLLRRAGADLDMEAVMEAAAESGVVLEVDGSHPRLDLDAEQVKRAIDHGIKIAIDSDAHALGEQNEITYGVMTARRGWASAADIVNTWSWEEIQAYKHRRRSG